MLIQGAGAILGQDVDPLDAGIEEIAQDKIDDLVFPAKGQLRLGMTLSQRTQPLSLAPRQHHGQSIPADIVYRIHAGTS